MLTYLAEPVRPLLGSLLRVLSPDEILASNRSSIVQGAAVDVLPRAEVTGLKPALARWRAQLADIAPEATLARCAAQGIHLLCPGD